MTTTLSGRLPPCRAVQDLWQGPDLETVVRQVVQMFGKKFGVTLVVAGVWPAHVVIHEDHRMVGDGLSPRCRGQNRGHQAQEKSTGHSEKFQEVSFHGMGPQVDGFP